MMMRKYMIAMEWDGRNKREASRRRMGKKRRKK